MKKTCFGIFVLAFILSCINDSDKKNSDKNIRKEIIDITIKYVSDKFEYAKETVDKDGIITISDGQVNFVIPVENQIKYIINPSKIKIGLIDNDRIEDAIITISSLKGQYLEMPENLILINRDGKLMISRTIEADMTILGIEDGVITAEILTRSRNSPLRDCEVCREVVKYRYTMGNLVRIE